MKRNLLTAGFSTLLAVLPIACTQLFQPCGSGHIPDTQALQKNLKGHIYTLADTIGERNLYHEEANRQAIDYICSEFRSMGYEPEQQAFTVGKEDRFGPASGKTAVNIEVRRPGTDPKAPWLIIGAHYDTRAGMKNWHDTNGLIPGKTGTPGANDNGSGIAAVLELARIFRHLPTRSGIVFVCYANEEPPFFQTEAMGSLVHADRIVKELGKNNIMGMYTPETLGCYSPRVNKKRKTAMVAGMAGLPDRCDYVAFMSTNTGRDFSRRCASLFTEQCRFPVRSAAFPYYTKGVAWSDDWSYMKYGIPSFAVTDTAYLRSDDYHETSDTPEKIDYREYAEVVQGLAKMTRKLLEAVPTTKD